MVILDINDSLLELSCGHLTVEQNVQLAVTPALKFWQSEVCTDEAHRCSAAPDVSTLACQVPAGRVQHLTGEVDHGDFGNVVCTSAHTSRERPQSDGARFGNDGVGDWAQRASIHE